MKNATVVFIHTLGGSADTWATVIDSARSVGLTTKAVELPGHGGANTRRPGGLSAAAASALDQLNLGNDGCELHLVGSGAGSRLAIEIARLWQHRVRSLTIASYAPTPRAAVRQRTAETATAIASGGMAAFADTYIVKASVAPRADAARRFRNQLAATQPEAIVDTLRWALHCAPSAVAPIATRTLCIRGSVDQIADAARFRALGDHLHASFVEVEDAGHIAYIDQPQAFAEVALNFILDAEVANSG